MVPRLFHSAGWVLAVATLFGLANAAPAITGVRPAEPQPTADELAPGLAVQYTYAIMNYLAEMKGRKFESGPPILHLDWRMGSGIVLTSKAREGVGAIVTGFIHFEKPGAYGFDVTSNDGVRLEIGGQLIHEDPGVHSDTTSDRIDVRIDQPGWYPIQIMYFQKRYTATLVVRWIGPGETGKLTPVPPSVLAHRKS
jgi:PA14 domain